MQPSGVKLARTRCSDRGKPQLGLASTNFSPDCADIGELPESDSGVISWESNNISSRDINQQRMTLISVDVETDLLTNRPNLIEMELEGILRSSTFRRSKRLRQMLEYITRQLLLNRGDGLKEYTIALGAC